MLCFIVLITFYEKTYVLEGTCMSGIWDDCVAATRKKQISIATSKMNNRCYAWSVGLSESFSGFKSLVCQTLLSLYLTLLTSGRGFVYFVNNVSSSTNLCSIKRELCLRVRDIFLFANLNQTSFPFSWELHFSRTRCFYTHSPKISPLFGATISGWAMQIFSVTGVPPNR